MKLLLLLNPAPTPQAHHQPRLCRLLILILLLLRTAMWIHPAPSSTGGHASPSLLRYRCCCYCCCCCWVNNAASYVHVCTISFTWSTLDHFGDPLAHSFNVSHLISSHLMCALINTLLLLLLLSYSYTILLCYLSLSLSHNISSSVTKYRQFVCHDWHGIYTCQLKK